MKIRAPHQQRQAHDAIEKRKWNGGASEHDDLAQLVLAKAELPHELIWKSFPLIPPSMQLGKFELFCKVGT